VPLLLRSRQGLHVDHPGRRARQAPVPHSRCRVELSPIRSAVEAGNPDIWIHYTDSSGSGQLRSRLSLHRDEQRGWYVRQVFLYWGDDTEAYAESGPADA
jgi:hypothetical protein